MMVVAIACAGSMVAAHGQIGGDEPGGHTQTGVLAPDLAGKPVKISSGVMAGRQITKVNPVYPQNAQLMEARVVLHVIITKSGTIKTVEAISGPAELKQAAVDAVKQWRYQPYLLNGEPAEVDTTVVVEFHPKQR